MKKLLLLSILQGCLFFSAQAQVLKVNNSEQLYDQWCWAGCSKTILDYYGYSTIQQCDIAEWVRTTAEFHDFGSIDCCTDATRGCNYWNYNWGEPGSIQDILIHFGNIQNVGAGVLTQTQITTEIQNNRLFVICWEWSTGGGHFVVGHGINGNNIYFMNPWYGEGLHIGAYSFIKKGIDNTSTVTHTWVGTNKITSNVLGVNEYYNGQVVSVYPNPVSSVLHLQLANDMIIDRIIITDLTGKIMSQQSNNFNSVNVEHLTPGVYFVQAFSGDKKWQAKFSKE